MNTPGSPPSPTPHDTHSMESPLTETVHASLQRGGHHRGSTTSSTSGVNMIQNSVFERSISVQDQRPISMVICEATPPVVVSEEWKVGGCGHAPLIKSSFHEPCLFWALPLSLSENAPPFSLPFLRVLYKIQTATIFNLVVFQIQDDIARKSFRFILQTRRSSVKSFALPLCSLLCLFRNIHTYFKYLPFLV